ARVHHSGSEGRRVRNHRAESMNLDTLKSFDKKTAYGVLAAAALSTAPDPGVGQRAGVLRTYGREAEAVLAEIYNRLRIRGTIIQLRLARRYPTHSLLRCENRFLAEPIPQTFYFGSGRRASCRLPPTM